MLRRTRGFKPAALVTPGQGSCVAGKPGEHELCGLELIDCGSVYWLFATPALAPWLWLSVGRNTHHRTPKRPRRVLWVSV